MAFVFVITIVTVLFLIVVIMLMAVLMILDIACAALIKIPPVERQTSVWAGVLNILCQPRVAVFLVWCFGCGLLTSVIWQWLLWYLSDLATKESTSSCGDSQSWVTTLLGINMAVQCFVGEVPMFFLSGWVLRNLGHAHTMSLVWIGFSLVSRILNQQNHLITKNMSKF